MGLWEGPLENLPDILVAGRHALACFSERKETVGSSLLCLHGMRLYFLENHMFIFGEGTHSGLNFFPWNRKEGGGRKEKEREREKLCNMFLYMVA